MDELDKEIERQARKSKSSVRYAPGSYVESQKKAFLSIIVALSDLSDTMIYHEPSLVRTSKRPPDIVVISKEFGVHVFEVKGIKLDQIEDYNGGVIKYSTRENVRRINPTDQVKAAMFDIKRLCMENSKEDSFKAPFCYHVIMINIKRDKWESELGEPPSDYLFFDDIERDSLLKRVRDKTKDELERLQVKQFEPKLLDFVYESFGDSEVLKRKRPVRASDDQSLGTYYDECSEAYSKLTKRQQTLSELSWEYSPKVVRGVAGSGKSIVLAVAVARLLQMKADFNELFENDSSYRILVVCYNRTLVPFLKERIIEAYKQRTGETALPKGVNLEIKILNDLYYAFSNKNQNGKGLWDYSKVGKDDGFGRTQYYLESLGAALKKAPKNVERFKYDVIFIDEAQDLLPNEFKILKNLCKHGSEKGEPSLNIFYDDAQNLYARPRPVWKELGIIVNVPGRAHVLDDCLRNTRQIIELSFNLLMGAASDTGIGSDVKKFAELKDLQERGLVKKNNGFYEVLFASDIEGKLPEIRICQNKDDEKREICERVKYLISEEDVRPSDILILSHRRNRLDEISQCLEEVGLQSKKAYSKDNKNDYIFSDNKIAISTVHSSKGYDAFHVLIASANEFITDDKGRAAFYVGCTRARKRLEIFGYENKGFLKEIQTINNGIKKRFDDL